MQTNENHEKRANFMHSDIIIPMAYVVNTKCMVQVNLFSEALILVSTNPQYDKRLFIEVRVQYMKIPSSEHVENMLCT